MFPNIENLALSSKTLDLWPYPSKHSKSDLILPHIGILVLSFETLEFSPYPYKH